MSANYAPETQEVINFYEARFGPNYPTPAERLEDMTRDVNGMLDIIRFEPDSIQFAREQLQTLRDLVSKTPIDDDNAIDKAEKAFFDLLRSNIVARRLFLIQGQLPAIAQIEEKIRDLERLQNQRQLTDGELSHLEKWRQYREESINELRTQYGWQHIGRLGT